MAVQKVMTVVFMAVVVYDICSDDGDEGGGLAGDGCGVYNDDTGGCDGGGGDDWCF